MDALLSSDLFPEEFFDAAPDTASRSEPRGLNVELRTYDSRLDSRGTRITIEVSKHDQDDLGLRYLIKDDHENSALVLVRTFGKGGVFTTKELKINSTYMREILMECIGSYPGIQLHQSPIVITGTPRCLFFYTKEIYEHGRKLQTTEATQHLVFLLKYMRHSLSETRQAYAAMLKQPKDSASMDWKNVWTLFRPGTLVCWDDCGLPMLSKVLNIYICECMDPQCPKHEKWELIVQYITHSGSHFQREERSLDILRYDGYKQIKHLSVFPLEYHPNPDAYHQKLLERGRIYLGLPDIHYKQYKGLARTGLSTNKASKGVNASIWTLCQSFHVEGRFVIDMKAYAKASGGVEDEDFDDGFGPPVHAPEKVQFDGKHPRLSENEIAICTCRIPAFSLKNREWCLLNIEGITDVEFNHGAFDSLLLPSQEKNMLRALIERYEQNADDQFDDIIKGKGRGLVFLLHGPPGVGKTLTAESIADLCQRPLYTVTSGDLGIDAGHVERSLSETLFRAESWNAIVLIDEADIFLARRGVEDVRRNSLVSVFLRMMEYFAGVMILTTNRLDVIDVAFLSRIHLPIRYHEHTEMTRRTLWQTFIERLSPQGVPDWFDDVALRKLSSYVLNGRQIKNAMHIAFALAKSAGKPLSFEDVNAAAAKAHEVSLDLRSVADSTRSSVTVKLHGQKRKRVEQLCEDEDEDMGMGMGPEHHAI